MPGPSGNLHDPHADMIQVRVASDPDYHESFGVTGERLWADPTEVPGVYRIDNIPMYTESVRKNDYVRVSARGDSSGVYELAEVVKYSGHTTFHVFVTERDAKLDPMKDPAMAPLWKAWKRLSALGCSYEGANGQAVYMLAIDAPPKTDLDGVREILDAGEAAEHWAWAGGGPRDGEAT